MYPERSRRGLPQRLRTSRTATPGGPRRVGAVPVRELQAILSRLGVNERAGSIKSNFPDCDPDEIPHLHAPALQSAGRHA